MEQETQTIVENKEIVQPVEEAKQEAPQQETIEQINWKKFRQDREIERKQKEEALKRAAEKEAEAQALKAAMEAILNKPQPQQTPQQNPYYQEDLTEDQRIEAKVAAALAAKEQQLEAERKRREAQELPQKLASTFTDFNTVCSTENLDYLEYHYPEVALAFRHAPDGYDKWAAVYKAVKRFVPVPDSRKDQAKAEKNFNKPQSMSVPGVTQVGDTAPIQLDDKRRADNWARMQAVMKGRK